MFRTFLKGIVFGLGVIVAFLIAGFISSNLDFSTSVMLPDKIQDFESWHDLSDEEKLHKATAVLILRYKSEAEDLMTAYVAEVYKKNKTIEVAAIVGDRRKGDDFYSRGEGLDRDGAIVYMTGSPAKDRSTLYLYDNRLAGVSDMPLNIFLRKFNEASDR